MASLAASSFRWGPKVKPLCLWIQERRRGRCSSIESLSQASDLLLPMVGGALKWLIFLLLLSYWFYFHVISVYHCGSDEGWSDMFFFTALNDSSSFSPRFALYGDLGNENPQSLARLQKETQLGMYDVILHIGKLNSTERNGTRPLHFSKRYLSTYAWNHKSAYTLWLCLLN